LVQPGVIGGSGVESDDPAAPHQGEAIQHHDMQRLMEGLTPSGAFGPLGR
jgi:hypothetical protein